METITLTGTPEEVNRLKNIISHDHRLPQILDINNDGTDLTPDYLRSRGFIRNESQTHVTWFNGIIILHEDDFEDGGQPQFSFATYVRGDGAFKGGFSISTEEQLECLSFALVGVKLEVKSKSE